MPVPSDVLDVQADVVQL
jgi:hypothetical protein